MLIQPNTWIQALLLESLIFLVAVSASADRGVGSVELSANPSRLPADGKSVATISAQVRDENGDYVPDGTEVHFTASLGVIDEIGETSAGVARVKLISGDIAGECVVTASWVEGRAVAQLTVRFGEGLVVPGGAQYITVEARDYLAYSVDEKVLEALGVVNAAYRTVKLEAPELQVDTQHNQLVARGRSGELVRLTLGDQNVECDLLAWGLSCDFAVIVSAKRGRVERVDFSSGVLVLTEEHTPHMPEEFDFADITDTAILIKASRIVLFPQDKIQFKNASVYVDGKRVLSLPFYSYSLSSLQPQDERYVGYGSGGITLNLPFYYSLTPSFSGALLVRHGESVGWGDYGQKPGWFVDLRQKYETQSSEGTLTLSQITTGDWGMHYFHSQRFGQRAQGYLYLDYPNHKDFYGNLALTHSSNDLTTGVSLYTSNCQDVGDSLSVEASLLTKPRPIAQSGLRYTLSARMVHSAGSAGDFRGMSQSLQTSIFSAPVALSKNVSLRTSFGLGCVWGASRSSGFSTLGTAVVDWNLSPEANVRINYRYAHRPSIYTTVSGKQTLSAWLNFGSGRHWRATVYGIKGLDYPNSSWFADFAYRLGPKWRLGIRSTSNEYAGRSYNDKEFSIGKKMGNRELLAVWSRSQHRLMLEMGYPIF